MFAKIPNLYVTLCFSFLSILSCWISEWHKDALHWCSKSYLLCSTLYEYTTYNMLNISHFSFFLLPQPKIHTHTQRVRQHFQFNRNRIGFCMSMITDRKCLQSTSRRAQRKIYFLVCISQFEAKMVCFCLLFYCGVSHLLVKMKWFLHFLQEWEMNEIKRQRLDHKTWIGIKCIYMYVNAYGRCSNSNSIILLHHNVYEGIVMLGCQLLSYLIFSYAVIRSVSFYGVSFNQIKLPIYLLQSISGHILCIRHKVLFRFYIFHSMLGKNFHRYLCC